MKKLVLILAVAFGASMVACSNSEKAAESNVEENAPVEEVVEEVAVVADSVAPDSVAVDTVAAAAAVVAE